MHCPSCRSEFTIGIDYCKNCEVPLLDSLPDDSLFGSPEAMAKSLEGQKLQPILVDNHLELRKVQNALARQKIPTLIADDSDMEAPVGVATRFYLMVSEYDFQQARNFLDESWSNGLQREGVVKDVSLENTEVCPACSAFVSCDVEECPECGLFLGLADE